MAPTAAARDLGADHAVAEVAVQLHAPALQHIPEAGPARPGLKLRLRRKQRLPARRAAVNAVVLHVDILAGERWLGPALAQDAVLLWRQLGAPLFLSLLNLVSFAHAT